LPLLSLFQLDLLGIFRSLHCGAAARGGPRGLAPGAGRLSLRAPLRWHGHLRDEPARLPWGYGYEIELSGVEFEEVLHLRRGGLRVSFTARPDGRLLPDLHAGDEVAVLTEARRPQVFQG